MQTAQRITQQKNSAQPSLIGGIYAKIKSNLKLNFKRKEVKKEYTEEQLKPFRIDEKDGKYFGVMGMQRITDYCETKNEVGEKLYNPDWETLTVIIAHIASIVINKKELDEKLKK